MRCICILDGDQNSDLQKFTITLPGNNSPEKVIMEYALKLYAEDSPFWIDDTILDVNYGKPMFRDYIKPSIDAIPARLQELRNEHQSAHGVERQMRKDAFRKHQRFFELLFKFWVHDPENASSIDRFYKGLNILFKKTAEFHGINPQIWTVQ